MSEPGSMLDWGTEDVYRSNYGAGPLLARILSVMDSVVTMERWHRRGGARTRFTLSVSYFQSPRCGWRLAELSVRQPEEG